MLMDVNGVYKPTYNLGAQSCMVDMSIFRVTHLLRRENQNYIRVSLTYLPSSSNIAMEIHLFILVFLSNLKFHLVWRFYSLPCATRRASIILLHEILIVIVHILLYNFYWLVVEPPLWKNDGVKVSWDDEIPNINGKVNSCSSHHQPVIFFTIINHD